MAGLESSRHEFRISHEIEQEHPGVSLEPVQSFRIEEGRATAGFDWSLQERAHKKNEKEEVREKIREKVGDVAPVVKKVEVGNWYRRQVIPGDVHATMLLQNAVILIENDEMDLAQNLIREILATHPEQPEAIYWLSETLKAAEKYEDMMTCYQSLCERSTKEDKTAYFLYAQGLYLMGEEERCLELYQKILIQADFHQELFFEAYKTMGNIYTKTGDIESAEENYNKAFALNSLSDVLCVNLGTLEIQKQNMQEALQRFRQAADLNSENDKAWVGLALVHRQYGDMELSWANLRRALDVNPYNQTALRLCADWGVQEQNYDEPIGRLIEYLAERYEDRDMSFMLAQVFFCSGRLTEAEIELTRTLALDPLFEDAEKMINLIYKERAKIEVS